VIPNRAALADGCRPNRALGKAKAFQLLKGNSSKWIHETFADQWGFGWQEGYGAFSIGISGMDDTVAPFGTRLNTIELKRSRRS
jgi:hypothetical protein